MDTKTLLALRNAGVDTDGALRRFSGNTALYEKFLFKFPADENFAKITPALQAGDWEGALTAAHTLKGVSGNLGMDRLYRACAETVALLRAEDYDGANASGEELEAAYGAILAALPGGLEK